MQKPIGGRQLLIKNQTNNMLETAEYYDKPQVLALQATIIVYRS
jgi:hypothetical protein